MPDLKLPKIPDRTPVKLTILVSPEPNENLGRYSAAYEAAYGQAASTAELISHMLRAFLDSDREFARTTRRGVQTGSTP